VRAYFAETRGKPYTQWAFNRPCLGEDAIPYDILAFTKQNSAFRQRLLSWESKLAPVIPATTLQKILLATDATRDHVAAAWDMGLFTAVYRDPGPFAPFLKHPDKQIRISVIEYLGDRGKDRVMNSLPLLTNALPSEPDPFVRLCLAANIVLVDFDNTAALAVLQAAVAGGDAEARGKAKDALRRREEQRKYMTGH
jgi:hypothetical protein